MKSALRELLRAEWEFMLATIRIQRELEISSEDKPMWQWRETPYPDRV